MKTHPRWKLDAKVLASGMYQFGERAVFAGPAPTLLSAVHDERITLLYNVTAQEILTNPSGQQVTGIRAITYDHHPLTIHASKVILAMGGIESVRLLWLSTGNGKHGNGLGNDYDQLGRSYMDHPQAHFVTITPKSHDLFEQSALYDMRWQPQGGYAVMGMLKLAEAVQRREQTLNFAFILFPRRKTHLTQTFQAYHTYADALNRHYIPPHPVHNLTEMVLHPSTMVKIAG